MKQKMTYCGLIDLRKLRLAKKLTIEQLASLTFCSSRTINRIEAENRTSNYEIAKMISQSFCYEIDKLFVKVDKVMLDAFARHFSFSLKSNVVPQTRYFLLYVQRISALDANIWGKTMWIREYNVKYELRALRELSKTAIDYYKNKDLVMILNKDDEWLDFLFQCTIGRIQEVIVSEPFAQKCIPYILKYYAVNPKILHRYSTPDIVLLGNYKGEKDVFSVC